MLKEYRYANTDVFVYEQESEKPRLLQANGLYPLSKFFSDDGRKVKAMINCSFFDKNYVYGRNQGDMFDDTYSDEHNGKYCDVVLFADGTYKYGKFNNWDYRGDKVVAGFSAATFLVRNGQDVEEWSSPIVSRSKITARNPQTAVAITKEGKLLYIKTDGRLTTDLGLTGYELRDFVKANYDVELLAQLDGGGSSELIVDGKIIGDLSDGNERSMRNALALLEEVEEEPEEEKPMLLFPCKDGWISQNYHSKHKAVDIGFLLSESSDGKTPVYAALDGVVEVADYYEEVVNGQKVKPIVCILRHTNISDKYDYFTAYWHLSQTPKNTGDVVKAGDEIGRRGNTGYSGGTHLHFVAMKTGKGLFTPTSYEFNLYAYDPLPYFYLTEGQKFDGKGEYEFPVIENEDVGELKQKVQECEQKIQELESQIKTLEEDKENLEIKYAGEVNRLTARLKAIKEYVDLLSVIVKE